ncbi:MAG: hypothetical protein R3E89_13445 [Thiolinea sp.]
MTDIDSFRHLADHDQPFWHPWLIRRRCVLIRLEFLCGRRGWKSRTSTAIPCWMRWGLWNVNLGYSCEPVKQAIADQLQQMPYYSSFRGTTTAPVVELGRSCRNGSRRTG